MIQELYSIFSEYDQLATCNTMLHNPAFGIGASKENRKESFNHFYTRFSATIAPIGFSESHKVATLRRLITTKLQLRIADQDLRQLEASMDVKDEFKPRRRL